MKIKKITIKNFKRFTDLTIDSIPQKAKLVILLGPNGCGKSSLFDAFKLFHCNQAYNGYRSEEDYFVKDINLLKLNNSVGDLINIDFYDDILTLKDKRDFFYFRTAYRNSPIVDIQILQQLKSPLDFDTKTMIDNELYVSENYQRLLLKTISNVYDVNYNNITVKELRDELIVKIGNSLNKLFPDLIFNGIETVPGDKDFYFIKNNYRYKYKNLSAGEKAVFDLILDIIVKIDYYHNTIFCIDEPELHINTKVQSLLLKELFNLIPDNSQLWIATHSLGMLKEAKKIFDRNMDDVIFINFDDKNFDDKIILTPEKCDTLIWNKMLEITLDDYSSYLSPEFIVLCEGSYNGKDNARKDFDSKCYANIFAEKSSNVKFFSIGGSTDNEKDTIYNILQLLSKDSNIIRLIDRDDCSEEEIKDYEKKKIKVLKRRHIESYLLDDEVLKKLCKDNNQLNMISEIIKLKKQLIKDSINRGNRDDDFKAISGEFCQKIKKLLNLKNCGNKSDSFMRDTLSKLITKDMFIYKELEQCIFGDN